MPPPVTSISRGMSESNVVLPAPVLPMIAVVLPGSARKEMSRRTGSAAPGCGTRRAELHLGARRQLAHRRQRRAHRCSVSSTSLIRSAQTAARGIIIEMNVAIITDMRICSR